MIIFGVVVTALLVAGTGVANALGRWLDPANVDDTGPLERALAGATIGTALWIAASWILALTHSLTSPALWILTAIVIAGALACLPRLGIRLPRGQGGQLLLILPILLWSLFALYRGAILPPASHDGLSYHLPRAVMMARAAGFEHFPAADARINEYPANYELLLAGVLILEGTDRLTEWVSTVMFALFLLATGAMTERWWQSRKAMGGVLLATATTPILLLHSSAHKNDVMTAVFAVAALLWGARWCTRGGRMSMLLLVVSLVIAGGTKPQAAGVLVGLAPFLVARAIRELRARRLNARAIAVTAVLAVAFFAVGGAATYVMLFKQSGAPGAVPGASPFQWGDYQNLWQVPILLLLAPFSRNDLGVWVPWLQEYWFWPRHEIFFSNYGKLFTVLVFLIPIAVIAARNHNAGSARRERLVGTLAAILATLALLPTEIRPVGFFSAFGRYLLFIVPVTIVFVIPPLLDAIWSSDRLRRLAPFLAAVLTVAFALEAWDSATRDRFTPWRYVRYAAAHPGTRAVWFDSNRAASVVDRIAGPHDTVAVGGSFGTWIHPAYGAGLTRPVILLPENASSSDVPAAAQWVAIDRAWNVLWSHPQFTDMGRFWKYIGHGVASPADTRLYAQLLLDRRFRLVYRNGRTNQAVFWRIGSTQGRQPPEWRGRR